MIGTVRRLHALLNVAFVRSDEPSVRIEFVVDTGLATGDRPLLGTALLAGSSLYAEFVEGGVVEIETLASLRGTRVP